MQREILGLTTDDPHLADHIESGNTLDNRDSNLRIGTTSQNHMNARVGPRNKSGLKGTSWSKKSNAWQAQIGVGGKNIHLGFYVKVYEAHLAYCYAAAYYHGEFARFE